MLMTIKVIYEDENILAIDKPAGVSVHQDGKIKDYTIADWVLENYPDLVNVGEDLEVDASEGGKVAIKKPGIVHRLDKETSGILLIAKNQETFLFLKDQFQNHTIEKKYLTFVYGHVSDPKASLATGKRGVINVPIGRSPNDIRMWTAGRGAREPLRESITEYIVLSRFSDVGEKTLNQDNKFSYLEVYPKTGRTHQIRVHMRYINHPVVSDPLYRGARNKALGMDRLALHAASIKFKNINGENIILESPLPPDFEKVLKTYTTIA